MENKLLETIKAPDDIKKLSKKELKLLAEEIRKEILHTVGNNGGHLSSNLGTVELTIALHRVFSTPEDAIVWDVGHQSYAHKLITGRYSEFHTLRQKGGISGFPKREESIHDSFNTGHASTSISAALGISVSSALQNKKRNIIAVIGDGALTGGLAFEAILCAGELRKNLIVILNDNQMSISKNTGAMSEYLSRFTMHAWYQRFKYLFNTAVSLIPFVGNRINSIIFRLKRGLKSIFYKNNIFVEFNFNYVGPLNGHNIQELEKVLKNVKKLKTPVVVHVRTIKGRGYSFAEENPAFFHGVGPFKLTDGAVEKSDLVTFTQAFGNALIKEAEKNEKITAITAAMASGTGLSVFKHLYPERFFDAGIAEGHAVTFASGLAAAGMKPVAAIYSTFLQRCVDQIIHDTALQNLPVVFAADRAGAVPHDGETHQGIFDIALFRCVPNLSILCPASEAETALMLQWALAQNSPVIIRYPKLSCAKERPAFSEPIVCGKGVFTHQFGENKILIVCTGGIYQEVNEAVNLLAHESIFADIYNIRFVKPVDENHFLKVTEKYETVIFAEDGVKTGGISVYLESLLLKKGKVKTKVLAFPDVFPPHGTRADILNEAGMSPEHIASVVRESVRC